MIVWSVGSPWPRMVPCAIMYALWLEPPSSYSACYWYRQAKGPLIGQVTTIPPFYIPMPEGTTLYRCHHYSNYDLLSWSVTCLIRCIFQYRYVFWDEAWLMSLDYLEVVHIHWAIWVGEFGVPSRISTDILPLLDIFWCRVLLLKQDSLL